MSFATLDEFKASLDGARHTQAYKDKMLHPLPTGVTEVDRIPFIIKQCTGRRVVEFGATGPLTEALQKTALTYLGVDRQAHPPAIVGFDLDDVAQTRLPQLEQAERIVLGEVLEHLSNPGWFLTRLKRQYPGVPVIITVPNAYCASHQHWIKQGVENVNVDHVAWYSPKVLACLLIRAGYDAGGLFWYHGSSASTAEGLVVLTQ